jgi:hypothetical protein
VDSQGLRAVCVAEPPPGDLQSRSVFRIEHTARDDGKLGSEAPEIFRSASVPVVPSRPCVGIHESEPSLGIVAQNRALGLRHTPARKRRLRSPESDQVGQ